MSDNDRNSAAAMPASKVAIVGDVGRRAVRFALTDEQGRFRPDTIRSYDPAEQSTISGALMAFASASGLPRLPSRCAIAVSGPIVGDSISVTHGRWFVSRSGLGAMLQAPPLILNDFAACGWALAAPDGTSRLDPIEGGPIRLRDPGAYCLIGVGSGLGVAVIQRAPDGRAHVLASEAGHASFGGGPLASAVVLAAMEGESHAERLLSEPGLVRLYRAVAEARHQAPRALAAMDVIQGAGAHDALAIEAVELFIRILWHFAGNLVLAYGAWDGVLLVGDALRALGPRLASAHLRDEFLLKGPYQRQLRVVPKAFVTLDHAELEGAAQALLAGG